MTTSTNYCILPDPLVLPFIQASIKTLRSLSIVSSTVPAQVLQEIAKNGKKLEHVNFVNCGFSTRGLVIDKWQAPKDTLVNVVFEQNFNVDFTLGSLISPHCTNIEYLSTDNLKDLSFLTSCRDSLKVLNLVVTGCNTGELNAAFKEVLEETSKISSTIKLEKLTLDGPAGDHETFDLISKLFPRLQVLDISLYGLYNYCLDPEEIIPLLYDAERFTCLRELRLSGDPEYDILNLESEESKKLKKLRPMLRIFNC